MYKKFAIDIERILLEMEQVPHGEQVCVQGVKNQTDPFYSLYYDEEKKRKIGIGGLHTLNHTAEDFIYPLFNMPYVNSLMEKFKMYRTRVITLMPHTCYKYHTDVQKRLHIPVLTNDKCMFIIEDEVYRFPSDGNAYLIDTTRRHTAINASNEKRTHIVGCVNENSN
tara:strand:+ start:2663 stop:3163 length:501 start_codon:yes stop_codon:yes gene_type:complete